MKHELSSSFSRQFWKIKIFQIFKIFRSFKSKKGLSRSQMHCASLCQTCLVQHGFSQKENFCSWNYQMSYMQMFQLHLHRPIIIHITFQIPEFPINFMHSEYYKFCTLLCVMKCTTKFASIYCICDQFQLLILMKVYQFNKNGTQQ